jgi:hypothetical protein
MNRTRLDPDAQLEAGLRRIRGALEQNRHTYAAMVEQIMAATGEEVAERVSARLAERHQRRMARWERRKERRRRGDPADLPRGVVSAVAAVACLAIALLQPELWWLVFVALGLGSSAAARFGRAARNRQAEPEAPSEEGETARGDTRRAGAGEREPAAPAEPPDPRVVRIQNLCDTILAELESGPPIVREVVTQPQATIGGLRQACLEIARRERELRTVLAAQQEPALVAEREALVTRIASERDDIVRDRLGQALRALEQQLAHRAELATAATRLEAENTRILYTLESLRMQLLRARSTDIGAPELGGTLRESLRELGTEVDAVAEALEWASAPGGTDAGSSVSPATSRTSPPADEAERTERQAAARRAAQAREAQRH